MLTRHEQLLELLKQHQFMSVTALSKALFASEATIRRDLNHLEKMGLLTRCHGGASFQDSGRQNPSLTLANRMDMDAKRCIARQAAALCSDNQALFLDASSTAKQMLPFLSHRKGITLFTNGLETAASAAELGLDTYLIGGQVNATARCCQGPMIQRMLQNIHVDKLFFSAPALSAEGEITHHNPGLVSFLDCVRSKAKEVYMLCVAAKFGDVCTYHVCHVSELTGLISDQPLPQGLNQLPIQE